MKIYKIKVNGKTYKVELEAIDEVGAPVAAASPVKEAEKKPEAKPVPTDAKGESVLSPIQGQVTQVKLKLGDKVKKGDVLFIIEAMKLENEVVSPFDGEVKSILVEKGAAVTAKQPLAIIG